MKMNKALEDRNSNIDLVKGIGIILLIIGHISDGNLQKVIYSFHMPLFVVISGFLFTYPLDKRGFIIQRAKSLLYPYVSFNLILLLIGVIHYVTGFPVWFFGNSRSAVAAVLSFVCGKGISVTWFLSFLFLIQVLECFLNTKKIAIVALSFVGCVGGYAFIQMSEYTSYEIWNIVSYPIITILRPLVALPFFEAGILLKKIIKKKNVSILIAFVALIVWFAGNVFYHEQVDLSTLMIHNPVLYYLLGICGSYALSIFCEKIVLIASGPIHFVGRYSLLYMFCNTIPNITIIASWLHMDEVVPIEFISIVVTETVLVLLLIRFGSFIYKYDNMKKLFLGCRKNEI